MKISWLSLAPWALIALLVMGVLWVNTQRMGAVADKVAAEHERDGYHQRLDTAVEVNGQQRLTIERLTETRKANDAILLNLTESLATIASNSELTRSDIQQLERTNAQVRDYLGTRVPPELAGVLNRPRDARADTH